MTRHNHKREAEMENRIMKLEYKPNCYVVMSFPQRPLEETVGVLQAKSIVSFVYDTGEYAAEWEVEHGPIQVWHKCGKDNENAREHYIYEYTNSSHWNWSQLAVDDYQLPDAAIHGRWNYIFNVLKDWAKED